MVTERQTRAFQKRVELIQKNKPVYLKRIMQEVGYAPSVARVPQILTESKGWEELKKKYADPEKALLTLNELADKANTDKDNRLKASVEIIKILDGYPANKSKIVGMFDKISSVFNDENTG